MPVQLPEILFSLPRNPIIAVAFPLVIGNVTGLVTRSSVQTWYKTLRKPYFQPPNYAFPIAWTYLYASMGLASHLLVKAYDRSLPGSPARIAAEHALKLYWLQYAFNVVWSPAFFGAHQIVLANIDILALLFTLTKLAPAAYQVDSRTAWSFVPYVAWVSLASWLNTGITYLNVLNKSPKKP